ncbi:MAG: ATP-binding cassette domain-containing protein [Melioribacteraceae bacterium]|nr:ATP-binding cassette domain-containing protein [Melioribacteraceae bacterium]MCF8262963.1 ATP-binding cassette domain-containing protein [Melioribacteraceae bacterium]MCF8413328.1 ATP-binding cassette domain-containing protein [Melioribacteraceae bacterium]MCF8430604.1 ATP-binding cassette domain-containing protein [Melioribacteraceae bacterium]
MYALEVKNLRKQFDNVVAVDDVSFSVPEGSIFGLIGRNGAGKTTTIRIMMNIYIPDEGEIILGGASVGSEFKSRVGYLPEERGLYKKMKVFDTLMYLSELKGKSGRDIQKKANEYLKRFDLFDRKFSKLEDLSKGNQQKVQFIGTILHDPDFIILDEPFSGLDPINTNLLKEIILEEKEKGKVIIFSTHLMDFAERMCDHIAMIDKGAIKVTGSMAEVKAKYANKNVSLNYEGDLSFLKNNPIIDKVENFGNTTGIRVKEANQTQELLKLLIDNNIKVNRFDANEISLHEIFVEVAGKIDGEVLTGGVANV